MLYLCDIETSWQNVLKEEFSKEYFQNLNAFLENEAKEFTVYPSQKDIFSAFRFTPFDDVKLVILGQDPYHGYAQAHGLSFSVKPGVKIPPSLRNIFKELVSDTGIAMPTDGYLEQWARQGVLLLNATLTVRANQAGSHQKKGWEIFTDKLIQLISEHKKNVIFLLWGNSAQSKAALIDQKKHFILKAAHPSPLSAYNGFMGCKHFSQANKLLQIYGFKSIDWNISGNTLF